jgi:hypothetical protein
MEGYQYSSDMGGAVPGVAPPGENNKSEAFLTPEDRAGAPAGAHVYRFTTKFCGCCCDMEEQILSLSETEFRVRRSPVCFLCPAGKFGSEAVASPENLRGVVASTAEPARWVIAIICAVLISSGFSAGEEAVSSPAGGFFLGAFFALLFVVAFLVIIYRVIPWSGRVYFDGYEFWSGVWDVRCAAGTGDEIRNTAYRFRALALAKARARHSEP